MRALVTGGSGFIGSHLIDELEKRGHETFNYDVKRGYDVRDRTSLNAIEYIAYNVFRPDVIIHLAGMIGTSELIECPQEAEDVNVIGTLNVLDACKHIGVPLIFSSKINPPDWVNPYTITKQACEGYCTMYNKMFNVDVCILRYLNVYGPGQTLHIQKFVPTFIDRALKGEPIPIWGTGDQYVDPVYVGDVVEATVKAWNKDCFGYPPIDIGTGNPVKVIDVAKKIIELTESKSKIEFLPMRRGEPLVSRGLNCADTRLMGKLLGLCDMTSLDEGLRKTIEWWRVKDDRRL